MGDPAESARQQYTRALANLRHARQRYVDAHVPMEEPDGWPPRLTNEQHGAVHAYAQAWTAFARAVQSCAETAASRRS